MTGPAVSAATAARSVCGYPRTRSTISARKALGVSRPSGPAGQIRSLRAAAAAVGPRKTVPWRNPSAAAATPNGSDRRPQVRWPSVATPFTRVRHARALANLYGVAARGQSNHPRNNIAAAAPAARILRLRATTTTTAADEKIPPLNPRRPLTPVHPLSLHPHAAPGHALRARREGQGLGKKARRPEGLDGHQ